MILVSIVTPLSSPVIGLLGEIASLEYGAGEVGPLVCRTDYKGVIMYAVIGLCPQRILDMLLGSHEGVAEVPLVLLDETPVDYADTPGASVTGSVGVTEVVAAVEDAGV